MRELIRQGYLYIAQPPLYKVKKGRSEQYIKDERALEDYLLDLALAGAQVRAAASAAPLGEAELRSLLRHARQYRRVLDRLALRRLDTRVIDAAVAEGIPVEADLHDEARLQGEIAGRLRAHIAAASEPMSPGESI